MSPQETHSPSVKIDEDALHRVRSAPVSGYSTGVAGGVFHARSNTRLSVDARSVPRLSHEPTPEVARDVEEGDDWRGAHQKKKQVFRGWTLLWLSYQSIGVIYGDIGTSPLYVFSSTFLDGPPDYEDVIQVLSIIIWSLTIMVTLKYVFIILHADNEGEGGTFSTYSLLTRYVRFKPFYRLSPSFAWQTDTM